MALKGKGKMPKVVTVNHKTKPTINVAKGSPTQGDNPYGSGAGDPTAYPGGHNAAAKVKKTK